MKIRPTLGLIHFSIILMSVAIFLIVIFNPNFAEFNVKICFDLTFDKVGHIQNMSTPSHSSSDKNHNEKLRLIQINTTNSLFNFLYIISNNTAYKCNVHI